MNPVDLFKKLSDSQKESDYIKGLVAKDFLIGQVRTDDFFEHINAKITNLVDQFNATQQQATEYVMGVKNQIDIVAQAYEAKKIRDAAASGTTPAASDLKTQIQAFVYQKIDDTGF